MTPLDADYIGTVGDPNPVRLNPNYPAELGTLLAGARQVAAAREVLGFGPRYPGAVARTYWS